MAKELTGYTQGQCPNCDSQIRYFSNTTEGNDEITLVQHYKCDECGNYGEERYKCEFKNSTMSIYNESSE